jgi:hypothetical protein
MENVRRRKEKQEIEKSYYRINKKQIKSNKCNKNKKQNLKRFLIKYSKISSNNSKNKKVSKENFLKSQRTREASFWLL